MKIIFRKDAEGINFRETLLVELKKQKQDEIFKNTKGEKKLVLGVEKSEETTWRQMMILVRKMIRLAQKEKAQKLALDFSALEKFFQKSAAKFSQEELAEMMAANFEMANYNFTKYKKAPKEGHPEIKEIFIFGVSSAKVKAAFRKGLIVGGAANHTRDLANTPGGDMTPKILAREIRKLIRGTKIKMKVLGEKQMAKLKMGGVLSVGNGSVEESQFIILEYKNASSSQKPIVLAGKAVTFDTGGINIKPPEGAIDMYLDMSGGAAAVGALLAIAKLGLKKNVIALLPAVENMASGSSYRPGDIVKTLSGKTVWIGNTDAEGRVILADALTYAERFRPKLVVDIATLTGAAVVALGQRANALFCSEEKELRKLYDLAEKTGDYAWPMPLWPEFEEEVKGEVSDLMNVGKYAKFGGSCTAAAFLWQFAKKYPWVHVDIAPRMALADDEQMARGASGTPVKFLVEIVAGF